MLNKRTFTAVSLPCKLSLAMGNSLGGDASGGGGCSGPRVKSNTAGNNHLADCTCRCGAMALRRVLD